MPAPRLPRLPRSGTRSGQRGPVAALVLVAGSSLTALVPFVLACTTPDRAAPEPSSTTSTDAAPRAFATAAHVGRPRDDAGNLIPRRAAPLLTPSDMSPVGSHAPDWDLDPSDPARDYVERYVQSTTRYGKETPCIHAQASTPDADGVRAIVEVRDSTGDGCHGSDAVRDTFAVSVANDRLTLAAPNAPPLANWPDKSDPSGSPPASPVEGDMTSWHSPIKDVLTSMKLVPMRLQWFGRGSYAVVSVAGWRPPLAPDAGDAALAADAKALCVASKGQPLALFAGMDRKSLLRIRCPASFRWDAL